MTHPTLGRPPIDFRAGFPAGAERLRLNSARLAARALEAAVDRDPTMTSRHDQVALRELLADAEVEVQRIADAVASARPRLASDWAEWVVPLFRRRRVPMDDLINISEGVRMAARSVLGPEEDVAADAAIDEVIRVFKWHRRLAGDARKRHWLIQLIYKGA